MRLIVFSLFGIATRVSAQDVHFSQMEFSPLTLNPALAGANSNLQGIVNYRTQWKSVATPYKTMGASIDGRLNTNKHKRNGHLVAGLNFFNDQSGDAKVMTTNVNISLGYHLILDPTSTLGLALYTGFGQRSINPQAGRWGSQYNGMNYDANLSSGEIFTTDRFSYIDAGAGLVYTYKDQERSMRSNDGKSFNYGFAMYHVSKPHYSFYGDDAEKLFMRFSVFANGNIGLGDSKWTLMPGIYYQRQKTAQEFLIGSYFKYRLSDASRVTAINKAAFFALGVFYRNKDAVVFKGMVEWSEYSLGFAYDVNVSSLTQVSQSRGGMEVFLRYNMSDQKRLIR